MYVNVCVSSTIAVSIAVLFPLFHPRLVLWPVAATNNVLNTD